MTLEIFSGLEPVQRLASLPAVDDFDDYRKDYHGGKKEDDVVKASALLGVDMSNEAEDWRCLVDKDGNERLIFRLDHVRHNFWLIGCELQFAGLEALTMDDEAFDSKILLLVESI